MEVTHDEQSAEILQKWDERIYSVYTARFIKLHTHLKF